MSESNASSRRSSPVQGPRSDTASEAPHQPGSQLDRAEGGDASQRPRPIRSSSSDSDDSAVRRRTATVPRPEPAKNTAGDSSDDSAIRRPVGQVANKSTDEDSQRRNKHATQKATLVTKTTVQQFNTEGGTNNVVQGTTGPMITASVSGERRKGRVRQEVIQLPDQGAPQVRQVRHRMPTPEPDIIERIYKQRTAPEIVEEITEIPMTPPPRIQEKRIEEPAGPAKVVKRTIRVPPRGVYGGYEQQQQQQQVLNTGVQYGGSDFATGSFSHSQQVGATYQPTAVSGYATGFTVGGTTGAVNYGSVGGVSANYQQQPQASFSFSVGGDGRSQPMPPIGCQPAFCFYC